MKGGRGRVAHAGFRNGSSHVPSAGGCGPHHDREVPALLTAKRGGGRQHGGIHGQGFLSMFGGLIHWGNTLDSGVRLGSGVVADGPDKG